MVVEFITSLRDQPKVDFINELIQTHTDKSTVIANMNEITHSGFYSSDNGIVGTPFLTGDLVIRATSVKATHLEAGYALELFRDGATMHGNMIGVGIAWTSMSIIASGDIDMDAGYTPANPLSVATKEFAESIAPTLPTGDGDYKLNIASGVATWVTV